MKKANLLIKPLAKTKNKKFMKIICKSSVFSLLIEIFLNI